MPDDRRRISIHKETFDALAADKHDGETWDGRLRRLLKIERDTEADGTNETMAAGLSDEDKREIINGVADEIETRLGRR